MNCTRCCRATRNSETVAENVLNRQFDVDRSDTVWVADTTFIPTRQGWPYLAIVLDLYARRNVDWTMSASNNRRLVCDALNMAVAHRSPAAELIHHSIEVSPTTASSIGGLMKQHGMIASMTRLGNCHDNAVAESFFANLKNELIRHRDFMTRLEARSAIIDYIELINNRNRQHATLNDHSPIEYEPPRHWHGDGAVSEEGCEMVPWLGYAADGAPC